MTDLKNKTPGEILADANVAEFIKTMGLGIAEAQTALDLNSVNQIPAFAEPRPGLRGKSLFDLGLSPAFYHYQHADISVALQITLKVEEAFGFDLGLNFGFDSNSTTASGSSDAETITESRTSSERREREAKISVKMTTQGGLRVNGQDFALQGANARDRINDLANRLRSGDVGIERALPVARTTPVNPACAPPSDQVQTSANAVAFTNLSSNMAVIRISDLPTAPTQDFTFNSGNSGNSGTTVSVQREADLRAHADAVVTAVRAAGFLARRVGPGDVLETVHFAFDGADLDGVAAVPDSDPLWPDNRTNSDKLRELAPILAASGMRVFVLGHTDRSGPRRYNMNTLATRRLDAVRDRLLENGTPADRLSPRRTQTLDSESADLRPDRPDQRADQPHNIGEDRWASRSQPDSVREARHRIAEVILAEPDAHFILVRTTQGGPAINRSQVQPNRLSGSAAGTGFVFVSAVQSARNLTDQNRAIVIGSTSTALSGAATGAAAEHSPEAYAANLARDINAQPALGVRAWASGNVCNLANEGDSFDLILITREDRQFEMTTREDVALTSAFSSTQTSTRANRATGNRTVAVGASIGLSYARKFEMSVNGNSSISARLVSVPAPPEFLEQIKAYTRTEG